MITPSHTLSYGAAQRLEVLRAGSLGYYRMRWRQRTQGRAREEGAAKKVLGPSSWFQGRRGRPA